MRRLLEELKNFLSNATPEQLEQAWKEVEQFKDVGPTVKDFCEQYKKVGKSEWFKKMYNGKSIGDILIVEGTDPNIKGYEELQKEDKDFQKGYAEALNDTA